jgi:hypothetical protein
MDAEISAARGMCEVGSASTEGTVTLDAVEKVKGVIDMSALVSDDYINTAI